MRDWLLPFGAALLGAALAYLALRRDLRRWDRVRAGHAPAWLTQPLPAPNTAAAAPRPPETRDRFVDAYVASCVKVGFDPELARRDAERIAAETFYYPSH